MHRMQLVIAICTIAAASIASSGYAQCNSSCQPTVRPGFGIKEELHIGIDPAVSQSSDYINAFISGANYWDFYYNNHGIPVGFAVDDAYGAADINVTLDTSLEGSGIGAVNEHDSNGRGTIRLNPDYFNGDF